MCRVEVLFVVLWVLVIMVAVVVVVVVVAAAASTHTAPGYVVLGRYSPPQALDSHHQHITIDLSISNVISLEYQHVTHEDGHRLFFTFMSETTTAIFAPEQPFTVQMVNSRGDPRSRYMDSIADDVC